MASPLTILPAINQLIVGASAVPMALTVKIMPASMYQFAASEAVGQGTSKSRANDGTH